MCVCVYKCGHPHFFKCRYTVKPSGLITLKSNSIKLNDLKYVRIKKKKKRTPVLENDYKYILRETWKFNTQLLPDMKE